MAGISAVSNLVHNNKLSQLKKSLGLGGLMTAGFCVFDFLTVPGAFKLDYNTDGEKVEGTNWKSGFKELGKSAIKCAGYLAVPAAILGLASGAGVIAATIAGLTSFGSAFALSSVFEKLLPEEQKLVAEACKEKGIDINQGKMEEYLA